MSDEVVCFSVDESFTVSSGLLNLVIVLADDVEQHGLGLKPESFNLSRVCNRQTLVYRIVRGCIRMCCGSPEPRCAAHSTGADPIHEQAVCNHPVITHTW